MSDTPVSPTGEPVIPPKIFKWVALGISLALAIDGSLVAMYPESKAAQVVFAILTAIAAVLGVTSPGLRKSAVVLLAVGALTLSGCQLFKPTLKTDLRACAADAVSAEVASLMPDVVAAIQGDTASWESQLDKLVANAGQAALCAIVAVVRNLEMGSGGAGVGIVKPEVGGLDNVTLRVRGYAYLSKHNL